MASLENVVTPVVVTSEMLDYCLRAIHDFQDIHSKERVLPGFVINAIAENLSRRLVPEKMFFAEQRMDFRNPAYADLAMHFVLGLENGKVNVRVYNEEFPEKKVTLAKGYIGYAPELEADFLPADGFLAAKDYSIEEEDFNNFRIGINCNDLGENCNGFGCRDCSQPPLLVSRVSELLLSHFKVPEGKRAVYTKHNIRAYEGLPRMHRGQINIALKSVKNNRLGYEMAMASADSSGNKLYDISMMVAVTDKI